MKDSTLATVRALLQTDETLTPKDRQQVMRLIIERKPAADAGRPLLREYEVRDLLGYRSSRSVRNLVKRGALRRVVLPTGAFRYDPDEVAFLRTGQPCKSS